MMLLDFFVVILVNRWIELHKANLGSNNNAVGTQFIGLDMDANYNICTSSPTNRNFILHPTASRTYGYLHRLSTQHGNHNGHSCFIRM